MSAIVSPSAYPVRGMAFVLSCKQRLWMGMGSSECHWRGTAALWHGIVQHFVVEISPFVTAGHVGGESNAAFKAEKSNSYVLGKFEIVGFSHVLCTLELAVIFLPPDGHISHFMNQVLFLLPSFGYQGRYLFFFLSSNCLLPSHRWTLPPACK